MRGRRNFGPLLLKYGVAVCLSLGGILYTILRNRGIKPSKRTPLLPPSTDYDHSLQTTPPSRLKQSLQTTPCACASGSVASEKCAGLSDISGPSESFRFEGKAVELQYQVSALREYISVEREEHDEEVRRLKGIVKTLKERERNLEIKLLEYYGLKEQETAVKELQNRININTMEAKLFALKIESLKADKKKLEAQMADSATVVSELEAARVKIKQLKKKLRHEAGNRKEQICALQEKVMKLQDVEKKALETLHYQEKKLLEVESDAHSKVQRIADLQTEAEELRSCNNSLRTENSELAQRLEYVQIIATSVLDDEEMEALVAEAERLRKQNADMAKEIEQLRSHRCSDAEELVYLRWVNACLRYELRNYQPAPDKTVARDLSKTLSPKSEERAKQLILEYARREEEEEEGVGPHFGSSERSSSSHASFLTPTDNISIFSSTPTTRKAPTSGKRKVFGKMMRLLREKRSSRSSSSQGSFGGSKYSQEEDEEEEEGMCRKASARQESFRTPELVKYAEALKEGRNLPSSRGSRRSASFGSLA